MLNDHIMNQYIHNIKHTIAKYTGNVALCRILDGNPSSSGILTTMVPGGREGVGNKCPQITQPHPPPLPPGRSHASFLEIYPRVCCCSTLVCLTMASAFGRHLFAP